MGTLVFTAILLIAMYIAFKIANSLAAGDAKATRIIGIVFGVGALVVFISGGVCTVDKGHVGVIDTFGSVDKDSTLNPGLRFVLPWRTVTEMTTQKRTYVLSQREGTAITANSKEGQPLEVSLSFTYELVAADAPFILDRVGANYVEEILHPAARSATRDVVNTFEAVEAATKQEKVANDVEVAIVPEIAKMLKDKGFEGMGIRILSVQARGIKLPEALEAAIQQKQQREQESLAVEMTIARDRKQKQWEIEQAKLEADKRREEAAGIADFQKKVAEGIDQNLLWWKYIEVMERLAASNNTTFIFAPQGASNPFVNPVQFVQTLDQDK